MTTLPPHCGTEQQDALNVERSEFRLRDRTVALGVFASTCVDEL